MIEEKGIGVVGALVLAELLTVSASLTQLDLSRNRLGPEGAKALAAMLKGKRTKGNGSLKQIDLTGIYCYCDDRAC